MARNFQNLIVLNIHLDGVSYTSDIVYNKYKNTTAFNMHIFK